jgi:hypothetical protein
MVYKDRGSTAKGADGMPVFRYLSSPRADPFRLFGKPRGAGHGRPDYGEQTNSPRVRDGHSTKGVMSER